MSGTPVVDTPERWQFDAEEAAEALLNVHVRHSVPVGEGLRLAVRTQTLGVHRHRSLIEAEEAEEADEA